MRVLTVTRCQQLYTSSKFHHNNIVIQTKLDLFGMIVVSCATVASNNDLCTLLKTVRWLGKGYEHIAATRYK